jgi:thiaminase
VALSSQVKYTDWATATYQRNLVSTSVDRGVSCGQRGRSPTVINLSFLDRKLTDVNIAKMKFQYIKLITIYFVQEAENKVENAINSMNKD